MHSKKAGRRNSLRRPPKLNINTTSQASGKSVRDEVPPSPPSGKTPVSSRGKPATGGRPLRGPPTPARNPADGHSCPNSPEPIDMSNKENRRPNEPSHRDSHDLSLSPRQVTRDSLVANMLLSLDLMSMGQMNSQFGGLGMRIEDVVDASSYPVDETRTRSGRGNGHNYSHGSENEGANDLTKTSSHTSRRRRSNSSTGPQPRLSRINSVRDRGGRPSMSGMQRPLQSGGKRASRNNSSSSIDPDYAQVVGSQRWAQNIGGHSPSFDAGPGRTSTATGSTRPPWNADVSNSLFGGNDYDAAPTPTVPAGPTRRLANAPSLPLLPSVEPRTEPTSPRSPRFAGAAMERVRSARSSRSATHSRNHESRPKDATPLPELGSAPAPLVGYGKPKDALAGTLAPGQPGKPNLFRRIFGANKSSTTLDSWSTVSVGTSVGMTNSRQDLRIKSSVPSRESHQTAAHTLQKKTSSFFRRRKPSVSERELPPLPVAPVVSPEPPSFTPEPPSFTPEPIIPPPQLVDALLSPLPNPSPVTSLRRAMDPYLQPSPRTPPATRPMSPQSKALGRTASCDRLATAKNPAAATVQRAKTDPDRPVRSFSPDYEPSPRAVIRTVKSDIKGPHVRAEDFPQPSTQTRSAAVFPPPALLPPDKSFLRDSSDDEDSRQGKNARATPHDELLGPLQPGPDGPGMLMKTESARMTNPGAARETMGAWSVTTDAAIAADDDGSEHSALKHAKERAPGENDRVDKPLPSNTRQQPYVPHVRSEAAGTTPQISVSEAASQSNLYLDDPHFMLGHPTDDDVQKARQIFDGKEDFIQKERAAAWMGEEGHVRQRTLHAYMKLFNLANKSIVESLREMCGHLVLRAETQQIDRILEAFSRRWCECNPNHGFKATDTIHTVCYSIMLLNTDLHLADVDQKMTRSQFVKNTMTTIRQSLGDANRAFQRASVLPTRSPLGVEADSGASADDGRSSAAASSIPPRADSAFSDAAEHAGNNCGPLVKAPFDGPPRAWEGQVELVLKDIYTSIRNERLPLFGAVTPPAPVSSGLSVMSMLKRTPSVLSKTPSDMSTRGRVSETARTLSRWTSKSRSRPRAAFGNGMSSSRTSLEDNNSLWSPTESSPTWSKQSLGRTHTTMSMDSFGSSYPRGDHQQSIGFANALTHAIIREDGSLGSASLPGEEANASHVLEDESLELAGPPWVKEGMVTHKRHADGSDKKAKDRSWADVFAVVQQGQLSIFSFAPNKSTRNKSRSRNALHKSAVVGGGNWQENATNLGTFSLRHALASTLPPSGHTRARPFMWMLSLSSGAVHLFQVGTPEIGNEFVSTANYWSARLSTHPLVGGISNVEYGWSEEIVRSVVMDMKGGTSSPAQGHSRAGSLTNALGGGRHSGQSRRNSMNRSSADVRRPGTGGSNQGMSMSATLRGHNKLPGDLVHIAEWTPPTPSMRPSSAPEAEQLAVLSAYVRGIEDELQKHNALHSPMLLAYSPRGTNVNRAMANWRRKSEYLLRESVRFRTYVESLTAAQKRKEEVYRERAVAGRVARVEVSAEKPKEPEEETEDREQTDAPKGEDGDEEVEGDVTIRPA